MIVLWVFLCVFRSWLLLDKVFFDIVIFWFLFMLLVWLYGIEVIVFFGRGLWWFWLILGVESCGEYDIKWLFELVNNS